MLILATRLKSRFSGAHTVALKNISVNGNKQGCSGFISLNDRTVYVNTERPGWISGYMYRTAAHTKDYTGGANCFANDLDSLVAGINRLLKGA